MRVSPQVISRKNAFKLTSLNNSINARYAWTFAAWIYARKKISLNCGGVLTTLKKQERMKPRHGLVGTQYLAHRRAHSAWRESMSRWAEKKKQQRSQSNQARQRFAACAHMTPSMRRAQRSTWAALEIEKQSGFDRAMPRHSRSIQRARSGRAVAKQHSHATPAWFRRDEARLASTLSTALLSSSSEPARKTMPDPWKEGARSCWSAPCAPSPTDKRRRQRLRIVVRSAGSGTGSPAKN